MSRAPIDLEEACTLAHRASVSASARSGSWPRSFAFDVYSSVPPCSTVIAERCEMMPSPSSRSRVVGVGSGARLASTIDHFPLMPKCTCMTTSGLPAAAKNAKRFFPMASMRLNSRPSMSLAPSEKRPFGEEALKRRPHRRRPCATAMRCTECPSTIAPTAVVW